LRPAADLVIFTSANAVRFGAAILQQWSASETAAIGPATARALQHAGHRVSIMPDSGYDSESLLADPRMQRVDGKRIALIKGAGGRERLAKELRQRGATVDEIAVYQRLQPSPSPQALRQLTDLLDAEALQVVTVTSLELADNLLAMLPTDLRTAIGKLAWLVPSERIAAALRERQLTTKLLRADSADDEDLVAALASWWPANKHVHGY
jgi:uroporphyrinogen-III synthase